MAAIWLTITGVAEVAPGTYTWAERVLTFSIAGFASLGTAESIRVGAGVRVTERLAVWAGSGLLQIVALWVSFLKPLAHD